MMVLIHLLVQAITMFFSMQEENVRVAFEYFDYSNAGVISKKDLEEIFSSEVVECSPAV